MADFDWKHLLKRGLILALEDRTRAETLKASQLVRDYAGLDKKRGRELEGQARFRMVEQGFEEVCALFGGQPLVGGVIPNSSLKIFQPFMRFGGDGPGVIFGLAAMPERSKLPSKNRSRLAGVTLNFNLTPRFDFDGSGPKPGDIFVLFLVARDREQSGKLDEIAIGVIDAAYEQFLFYERLDKFLADDADAAEPIPTVTVAPSETGLVRLKATVRPFVPPESPPEVDDKKGKA
jgi:hypothetical protein